jgi:hypothetical protein
MKIQRHTINAAVIAELISDETIINNAEEGFDLVGNLYFQGFDSIIINEKNVTPEFFDLRNGLAGEVLQKFSTYRISLAIVGDFSNITSKSLKGFMLESNKNRHINFVATTADAIKVLSAKSI